MGFYYLNIFYIQGDDIMKNTQNCEISVDGYGDAYIFMEDKYEDEIYKNYLKDGGELIEILTG